MNIQMKATEHYYADFLLFHSELFQASLVPLVLIELKRWNDLNGQAFRNASMNAYQLC